MNRYYAWLFDENGSGGVDMEYFLDRLEVIDAENEVSAKQEYILRMGHWLAEHEKKYICVRRTGMDMTRYQCETLARQTMIDAGWR